MRSSIRMSTALVTLSLGLAACGTSRTATDQAACDAINQLGQSASTSTWNTAFAKLANADDTTLRGVGQDFTAAILTSKTQAQPYLDRAKRACK